MTKIFLPIFVEPWSSPVHLAFCLSTNSFMILRVSKEIVAAKYLFARIWTPTLEKCDYKISSIPWSLFITIRRLTGRLRSLARKKKREKPVSRGRMANRHAKSFTPVCTKRHQVHGVADGTFATHAESAWTDFFSLYIEAEWHRYTTLIKSTPRLFKMELFCREEYFGRRILKWACWMKLDILFYIEYWYRYIHLFSLFQLNFQKSIRIWSRLGIFKYALL